MKPRTKPPFIPAPDASGHSEHDHYFMVPSPQHCLTLMDILDELCTMLMA